jgi:hypothetical protein
VWATSERLFQDNNHWEAGAYVYGLVDVVKDILDSLEFCGVMLLWQSPDSDLPVCFCSSA